MTNRISSRTKLLTGAAVLIALGLAINFVVSQWQDARTTATGTKTAIGIVSVASTAIGTEPVGTLPQPENRLLTFTVTMENGSSDIYVVQAGGRGMTNLTNHPAYDSDPFWSPDGKRIAFASARTGDYQIYSMDADGSNVIQLTDSKEGHWFFKSNPWSPDGNRLLFMEAGDPGFYVMDAAGQNETLIFPKSVDLYSFQVHGSPSWSPDGEHIAFTALNFFGRRLYIVDTNGDHLVNVPLADYNLSDYAWSQDGQSIFFTVTLPAELGITTYAYEYILNGEMLIERGRSPAGIGDDWWTGTSLKVDDFETQFTWQHSDGTISTFSPFEKCQMNWDTDLFANSYHYYRSQTGNLLISMTCPNTGDLWLYWANSDGTVIKKLLDFPAAFLNLRYYVSPITWSPDERFIIFSSGSSKDEIYTLDVQAALKDPSVQPVKVATNGAQLVDISFQTWQPISNHETVEEKPAPAVAPQPALIYPPPAQADDNLLAFVAERMGHFGMYIMRGDGSGITNLIYGCHPSWSPDGKRIAFERHCSESHQVYLMDADGSNVIQLTDGEEAHWLVANPWSPNGNRLLFQEEGDPGFYVMDADGQNKIRILPKSGELSGAPSWSPDGEHIAFIVAESQDSPGQLYIVDANGDHLVNVPPADYNLSDYAWSQDGQSIFFTVTLPAGHDVIAYEYVLNGEMLIERGRSPADIGDYWWTGTSLKVDEGRQFIWQHSDGTFSNFNPWEHCQPTEEPQNFPYHYKRSRHGNLLISAQCSNHHEIWLYWANSDGTVIKQLLDSPIIPNHLTITNMDWSPDERSMALTTGFGREYMEMYIVNVEAALSNPSIRPLDVHLGSPFYMNGHPGYPTWQPEP